MSEPNPTCSATTLKGRPCSRPADGDDGLCFQHRDGHDKASDLESELRAMQVKRWLSEARDPAEIVQLAGRQWGIAERQARHYISRARELLSDEMEAAGLCSGSWHIWARLEVYRRCMEGGDHQTAVKVLADLAKLQGLYERAGDDDRTVRVKVELKENMTLEELDAAISSRLG